jgi:hypothetical protein
MLVLNKGTPLATVTYVITYPPVSPIGFVLQKSLSSLSLCTQCASIAHSQQQISNIACHSCNCHVRKKFNKQQCVLCEVAIQCNQHKLLIQEIEDEVIVFDGGNPKTPLILPSDGLTWRCMPVSDLYVEHKTNSNSGLSCPWVNNSLPFIWLPCSNALSIIASSGLNRIYAASEACEKLRKVPLIHQLIRSWGRRSMAMAGEVTRHG